MPHPRRGMAEGLPAVPLWLQVAFPSRFFGEEEGEGEAACSQTQIHPLPLLKCSRQEILCHRYLLQGISSAH